MLDKQKKPQICSLVVCLNTVRLFACSLSLCQSGKKSVAFLEQWVPLYGALLCFRRPGSALGTIPWARNHKGDCTVCCKWGEENDATMQWAAITMAGHLRRHRFKRILCEIQNMWGNASRCHRARALEREVKASGREACEEKAKTELSLLERANRMHLWGQTAVVLHQIFTLPSWKIQMEGYDLHESNAYSLFVSDRRKGSPNWQQP